MTDRISAYIVTLAEDIRDDEAEQILNALEMVKGVLSAEPVVADVTSHVAEQRAELRWREALWNLADQGPRRAPEGTTP